MLPEKRRSVQEPAVIAKSGDLDTLWGGGSKMTEKLKIQPETWSLPGSCISPCFTTTSYKPWKKGAAATEQTHRVKTCRKDRTGGDKSVQNSPRSYHTKDFAELQA